MRGKFKAIGLLRLRDFTWVSRTANIHGILFVCLLSVSAQSSMFGNVMAFQQTDPTPRDPSQEEQQVDISKAINELKALVKVIKKLASDKKIRREKAATTLRQTVKGFSDFYYLYGGTASGNGQYEKKYGKRPYYDAPVHLSARIAGGLSVLDEKDHRSSVLSQDERKYLSNGAKDLSIYLNQLKKYLKSVKDLKKQRPSKKLP